MQAIVTHTEKAKKAHAETPPKALLPGSPIIEYAATEQGQKWIDLTNDFAKDGVKQPFFGIVINGRVSSREKKKVNLNFDIFSNR